MATTRIATTETTAIRMRKATAAAAGARSTLVVARRDSTRYFGGPDLR